MLDIITLVNNKNISSHHPPHAAWRLITKGKRTFYLTTFYPTASYLVTFRLHVRVRVRVSVRVKVGVSVRVRVRVAVRMKR